MQMSDRDDLDLFLADLTIDQRIWEAAHENATRSEGDSPPLRRFGDLDNLRLDGSNETDSEAAGALVLPGRSVLQLGLGHRVEPNAPTCH
jgi:hypothetical protein